MRGEKTDRVRPPGPWDSRRRGGGLRPGLRRSVPHPPLHSLRRWSGRYTNPDRAGFGGKQKRCSGQRPPHRILSPMCRMPGHRSGDDERAANTVPGSNEHLSFCKKVLSLEHVGLALVEAALCLGGFCAVKKSAKWNDVLTDDTYDFITERPHQ